MAIADDENDNMTPEDAAPLGDEAVSKVIADGDLSDQDIADIKEVSTVETDDGDFDPDFYKNLVIDLDDDVKAKLESMLEELVEQDEEDNDLAKEKYEMALKRSGLGDDAPGGADFEGASRVVHPFLTEAAIDFQSSTVKELIPPDGPVKIDMDDDYTPERYAKADRVQKKLNDQFVNECEEYIPSMERMLSQLPLNGDQYIKVFWNHRYKRPWFDYVPSDMILIPSSAQDFYTADRITHRQDITDVEFSNRVNSGLYDDVDLDNYPTLEDQTKPELANEKIQGISRNNTDENPEGIRTIYETQIMLCMEDFGAEKWDKEAKYDYVPYIISRDASTNTIIAMYRNWEKDDPSQKKMDWIVQYTFLPWRGPKGIGLIQVVGGLSAAATGSLRALLDSAMIQNMPTGLKLKGARMSGQNIELQPIGITEIDADSNIDDIKKIFMPLPFNGPSSVLFSLLGFLVDAAKGVVRTSMDDMQDANQNTPVGTTMARIEQGMKVFSAIFSRLHRSQKKTIDIVCRLDRMYLEADVDESVPADQIVRAEDFQGPMDIKPVSDPNIYSDAQRITQIQGVMQLAMQSPPGMFDMRAVNQKMLEAMKVPDIDDLMPKPDDQKDENPVTENVKIGMGSGAYALPDQDHMAHMKVHLDWYRNPVFGSNSLFAQSIPLMLSHLKQHLLLLYAAGVNHLASTEIGTPVAQLLQGSAGQDPDLLNDLSRLLAHASPEVNQAMNEVSQPILQELQQMNQIAQSMQPPPPTDPGQVMLQSKQMDMQAKSADTQAETQDNEAKNQIAQQNLVIERQKLDQDADIAAADNQTKLQTNNEDNQTAEEISLMRLYDGHSVGGLENGKGLTE